MKLNEITAAMQTYQNQRNAQGGDQMCNWFAQGNMFSYLRDSDNVPVSPDKEAYVHAYPGIHGGQLIFFLISGSNDIQGNTNIAEDVQVCSIATGIPSETSVNGLPTHEALQRINLWDTTHCVWLKANVGQPNSVFSAFAIPQNDTVTGNNHEAFLGLVATPQVPGNAIADLIIENTDASEIVYMDTVDFIPPMGGGHLAASRFYLLSLV